MLSPSKLSCWLGTIACCLEPQPVIPFCLLFVTSYELFGFRYSFIGFHSTNRRICFLFHSQSKHRATDFNSQTPFSADLPAAVACRRAIAMARQQRSSWQPATPPLTSIPRSTFFPMIESINSAAALYRPLAAGAGRVPRRPLRRRPQHLQRRIGAGLRPGPPAPVPSQAASEMPVGAPAAGIFIAASAAAASQQMIPSPRARRRLRPA